MAEMDDYQPDEQDQSEAFDEDNLDATEGGAISNELKTLEDIPEVFDVTQAVGDAGEDEEDEDADQAELAGELAADGVEPEADERYGIDRPGVGALDTESDGGRASDEVELVYTGLMRNVKGAQASAAHWEARRLSDDDIEDLGYSDDKGQSN